MREILDAVYDLAAQGRRGFRASAVASMAGVSDAEARETLIGLSNIDGQLQVRLEVLDPDTGATAAVFGVGDELPESLVSESGEEFNVRPELIWVTFSPGSKLRAAVEATNRKASPAPTRGLEVVSKRDSLSDFHAGDAPLLGLADGAIHKTPNTRQQAQLANEIEGVRPAKSKILLMTADPSDAGRLRLGREAREIEERLLQGVDRDSFELQQTQCARPGDVSDRLLRHSPSIVHFSGHGAGEAGLCFENDQGKVELVTGAALNALFALFSGVVDCVILNACYSETQAAEIAKHVPFVVGMNNTITDGAATKYSAGFYKALTAGQTIQRAHAFGLVEIQLHGIDEADIPVLHARG